MTRENAKKLQSTMAKEAVTLLMLGGAEADTLDENYAALWAALEAELSALSAQGADSAGCSYADGAITVWA